MRSIAITLLLFAGIWFRGVGQPILESRYLAKYDLNGDGISDFTHFASVSHPNDAYYVGTSLFPSSGCISLQGEKENPYFADGDPISTNSIPYNSPNGSNRVLLASYIARHLFQSEEWGYYDAGATGGPGDQLSVIIGLRLEVGGQVHHGWVRFTRPNLHFETLFSIDGQDWNPIPEAPIGAGLPPEIPITAEPLPGGAGIRLSWPPGLSNWILESTLSLSTPVVWQSFPSGGASADVSPVEAGRYFRLRRP